MKIKTHAPYVDHNEVLQAIRASADLEALKNVSRLFTQTQTVPKNWSETDKSIIMGEATRALRSNIYLQQELKAQRNLKIDLEEMDHSSYLAALLVLNPEDYTIEEIEVSEVSELYEIFEAGLLIMGELDFEVRLSLKSFQVKLNQYEELLEVDGEDMSPELFYAIFSDYAIK